MWNPVFLFPTFDSCSSSWVFFPESRGYVLPYFSNFRNEKSFYDLFTQALIRLALLDFQARVSHDPYGAFVSWDVEDHNPCSWSHVHCVFGHVQALGSKIQATPILNEHGELILLTLKDVLTLYFISILSDNHFSGVLPKELGELNRLEVLDLRDNNLIGSIPPEIGRMQSLTFLLLYNNNLEGTIPPEIESLNLLYELQYNHNFTFGVTDAIGNLNRKLGRWFSKGILDNSYANEENGKIDIKNNMKMTKTPEQDLSLATIDYQILKGSQLTMTQNNTHNRSHNCVTEMFKPKISVPRLLPVHCVTFMPEIVRNVHIDGTLTSRKLAEEPANLVSASSSRDKSARNYIIALPSSRSSGSFPAVGREKIKISDSPSGSPGTPTSESESNSDLLKIMIGVSCGAFLLITALALFLYRRFSVVKTMGPWRPGLSKQLQKAFVTGIPKLDRAELETACEDFSNIIETMTGCTLYKGTLSNGVEICVASTTITTLKDWSKHAEKEFHKKIDTLSRVNHKNFVNLIGYCEEDEPFARMMVFEYAPSGSLSEHLHVQMLEHLDWSSRMRIIMGVAYCLQCLHELSPPVKLLVHISMISQVADMSFWREFESKAKRPEGNESMQRSPADKETNIYSFGAKDFLTNKQNINHIIDPRLKSFKQNELEVVCKIIQDCIQKDASKRPTINEIVPKLREVLMISPEQATPRLSPLWWAELELLSEESS
ncbi:Leucine rich repeat 4 [Cynara cardunculus var. scolymus]|uniref:Leucine rich repeat 4 n=1 Tax=Cynara cardunculus var. scolymus TaxID=59895 RepID=A0A103XU35_CYNCS|nr:Leucine rich repeat 4 [Cynara cardunculus var. scolymus]